MARAEAKLKELRFESVVDYAPETQAECEVYFTYKREIKKKNTNQLIVCSISRDGNINI